MWIHVDRNRKKNLRIFNGYEVCTENSVTGGNSVQHHEACRVMPNSYPDWWKCLLIPKSSVLSTDILHEPALSLLDGLSALIAYEVGRKTFICKNKEDDQSSISCNVVRSSPLRISIRIKYVYWWYIKQQSFTTPVHWYALWELVEVLQQYGALLT